MEELMQQDQEDRKKLEKGKERITHKIAKDLEKADRKRKAEEENRGAMDQEETDDIDQGEAPSKRAKPSTGDGAMELDAEMDPSSSSGLAGGAGGAPGETLKRKREEVDSDPGIDIDRVETLGGMLSRISVIEPEVQKMG